MLETIGRGLSSIRTDSSRLLTAASTRSSRRRELFGECDEEFLRFCIEPIITAHRTAYVENGVLLAGQEEVGARAEDSAEADEKLQGWQRLARFDAGDMLVRDTEFTRKLF